MPTPGEDLPEIDEFSSIGRELKCFRDQWSPANPAFGDAKWQYVPELANRIVKAIDFVKEMGGEWEVAQVRAAAREEIEHALTQNMPRKTREDLQLYADVLALDLQENNAVE